ncbi:hypothetical protein [Streptomyces sp. TP-A0356]|uniref:hypothetical protein n=1 Tax=Streptomyces sp. TP-A0356 TaxID=1359208 RepID=UPI00099F1090|nr:hypothetical protein [Streptomyces sp. TP-A0356]
MLGRLCLRQGRVSARYARGFAAAVVAVAALIAAANAGPARAAAPGPGAGPLQQTQHVRHA